MPYTATNYQSSNSTIPLYVLNKIDNDTLICSIPSYEAWFHIPRSQLETLLKHYGHLLIIIDTNNFINEIEITGSDSLVGTQSPNKLKELLSSLSTGIELLDENSIFENPVVSVTSRCNLRCPYCYMSMPSLSSSEKKDIDKEKIKHFIDKMLELGQERTRTMQFFGGEPTLHPDLPELIDYALKKNLYVRISTNGTTSRIRSKRFEPYIKNRDVEWRVALDSHIPKVHEISRGIGTFKSIHKNLEYLKENDSNVSIKTVLSSENINDFPDYIRYGYNNGFRVAYGVLGTVGEAKKNSLSSNLSRLEVIEKILELYQKEPEIVSTLGPSPFGRVIRALYVKNTTALPPFFFYMHHNEKVYPMDELAHDEFQVGSWDNIDVKEMRTLHSKHCLNKEACLNCPIDPFCYKGSYADTYETSKSLDGEFTSCEERRNIYARIMSLGRTGSHLANAMFSEE